MKPHQRAGHAVPQVQPSSPSNYRLPTGWAISHNGLVVLPMPATREQFHVVVLASGNIRQEERELPNFGERLERLTCEGSTCTTRLFRTLWYNTRGRGTGGRGPATRWREPSRLPDCGPHTGRPHSLLIIGVTTTSPWSSCTETEPHSPSWRGGGMVTCDVMEHRSPPRDRLLLRRPKKEEKKHDSSPQSRLFLRWSKSVATLIVDRGSAVVALCLLAIVGRGRQRVRRPHGVPIGIIHQV